jgi:CBS domain-containing protein
MEPQIQTPFMNTIADYTRGFHVSHIATFDLKTCTPEETIADLIRRLPDYDQIPVKENGQTIGVWQRATHTNVFVKEQMLPLNESLLVSADEPLMTFLPYLAQYPYYRLVLKGVEICGIVTRSDVLKLPVRLYAFAIYTNLELTMKELILKNLPEDSEWKSLLSPDRQAKIQERKDEYKRENIDPALIDFTEFYDKYGIIKRYFKEPSEFEKDMKKVQKWLRNPIAHARNFAPNNLALVDFINLLSKAQNWTEYLMNK